MPTTSSHRSAGKLIIMPKPSVDATRPSSTHNSELPAAVLPRLSSGEASDGLRIPLAVQFAVAHFACPNCGAQRGQYCRAGSSREYTSGIHTGRRSEGAQLRRSNRKLHRDFRNSLRQAITSTAHPKMTPAQNAPEVRTIANKPSTLSFSPAIHPSPTRDSELRAAVLELVLLPNPVMDGLRIRETLKIVGLDVTQSEMLSVLQHLHDHGYIICEEKLRPFVPLTDLARLSRIEITADGCGLVEQQASV
jgi:hypothetical protein